MQIRLPDVIHVYDAQKNEITANDDVFVGFSWNDTALVPNLYAKTSLVGYLDLRWIITKEEARNEAVHIMGDAWERAYGSLCWKGNERERLCPWYMLVSNGSDTVRDFTGRRTDCYGVKVRPNAFLSWQYNEKYITLHVDVRNGARGVNLNGRSLDLCEIVMAEYRDISAYDSLCTFVKLLCNDGIFAKEPVYGFNNWYYAYGNTSEQEVMRDAKELAKLTKNIPARPYMVLDDGWQKNRCDGPWDELRDTFSDMKKLADAIKAEGVKPGIWVRPLRQTAECNKIKPEWRMQNSSQHLDPTNPEALEYIKSIFTTLKDWGYQLIKYDFVTYDIVYNWGTSNVFPPEGGEYGLYNPNITTAEAIKGLYAAIREAVGEDVVLIGCNAVGHLLAGYAEAQRIGDDTSGREWHRTHRFGVNVTAFRMAQNNVFFAADADCIGITNLIPWKQNKEWLKLLSYTYSPLFASWDMPKIQDPDIEPSLEEAFRESLKPHTLVPLDWMENMAPAHWLVDGKQVDFDWYMEV